MIQDRRSIGVKCLTLRRDADFVTILDLSPKGLA